jgi:hypothetical protein
MALDRREFFGGAAMTVAAALRVSHFDETLTRLAE